MPEARPVAADMPLPCAPAPGPCRTGAAIPAGRAGAPERMAGART